MDLLPTKKQDIYDRILIYSELNKSPQTKKSYYYAYIDFVKFMAQLKNIDLPEDKSIYTKILFHLVEEGKLSFIDNVINYIEHLKFKKQAARTIVIKLSALKHYINTLKTMDYINWDISSLPGPKVEKSKVEGPNEEVFKKVLMYVNSSWKQNDYISKRNALAFYILVFCGLRESEVISIKIEDINHERKTIKTSKKGYKEFQETRVPDTTFYRILEFLQIDGRKEGYLFVGKSEINPSFKMERTTLWRIVKSFCKDCGYPNLHPHAFRHFFVTEALEASENKTRLAMKATGHKSEAVFNDYEDKRKDEQGIIMNKIEKKWIDE